MTLFNYSCHLKFFWQIHFTFWKLTRLNRAFCDSILRIEKLNLENWKRRYRFHSSDFNISIGRSFLFYDQTLTTRIELTKNELKPEH